MAPLYHSSIRTCLSSIWDIPAYFGHTKLSTSIVMASDTLQNQKFHELLVISLTQWLDESICSVLPAANMSDADIASSDFLPCMVVCYTDITLACS